MTNEARPMTPTNAPDVIPADPCPFCGSQPIVTECRDTADGFVHDYAVRCNECGINIVEEYRDDAVASWNRRAPRAPLAAPVAEVRARYSGEDDFGERDVSWLVKPSDLPSGTKLYSAIPAPGTAPSGTAEGWKPIETAPNGKSILLHYDDGEIVILEECDNDDEWLPYPGKQRFCSRPTHWMSLPAAPPTSTASPASGGSGSVASPTPAVEVREPDAELVKALSGLVTAVGKMRVPQNVSDVALLVMVTLGPALSYAQDILSKHGGNDA